MSTMRWIIGDVHGMLKPLDALLKEISRRDPQARFYFVGDYVNRGPDSRGVIELLLALPDAKFIRGNHDDVLDHVLHGIGYGDNPTHGDRFMLFQWFLQHGLLQTLRSYGATDRHISHMITQRTAEAAQAISDLFPPAHRQFIRSLPAFIDDSDLFLIHGKWPVKEKNTPRDALSGTPSPGRRHEILWGRFEDDQLMHRKSWPKTGFFGHTPVVKYAGHAQDYMPIIANKMILLDTGAVMSPEGRLSAICAEDSTIVQADGRGKLIRAQGAPPA
jgi:serine/threonine protein phosphatase 1